MLDEHLLLKQMADGHKHAFDLFYQKFHRYVFQIALKILSNREEAEDICHDVFLEIYQKPHQFNDKRGSVKAWIAVKTRSRAIDRLRKKSDVLANKLEDILTNSSPAADEFVLKSMESNELRAALKLLPEEQQQAIYYMYFEHFTQREIALKMDRPLGSVKSFVRYGLQHLRKQKSLLRWIGSNGGDK
ncbi:sigma-70 family RNA polymerase sigma factor [Gracilibacillus sp. YIM 98692]|uniref:RNA polymerase sigma factor n=1 Tax=Gracilibacillus sp. YIM 98692 TaxID=2663532 RepID=UPI0013D74984|nr:sigma-70 family RNA polymerase sigma factor [Gracilibacillus sp. YIM 98692]